MITVTLSTRDVAVTEKETLTVGSVGIGIAFAFSEDWDGLNRVACFRMGDDGEVVEQIIISPHETVIPAAVLTEEGEPVFAGAYGVNGNGDIVIPTRWGSLGVIRPGTESASLGTMPNDPEDYWTQVLGLAGVANTKATTALETAADAKSIAENALTTVNELAEDIVDAVSDAVTEAADAAESAKLAESWAVGGTGTRAGEDTDNAKFYAEMAQQQAESSGYIFANVNEETGKLEVTVVGDLQDEIGFNINTTTGELEVTMT